MQCKLVGLDEQFFGQSENFSGKGGPASLEKLASTLVEDFHFTKMNMGHSLVHFFRWGLHIRL